MKIITISGKARHGKDFTANILKDKLEQNGNKVMIAHFGDLVKYVAKTFFNWDGQKDEEGRSKLQYIGTDVVRRQKPDFWVDFIVDILKMFPDEWDYVIIPDTRFHNENDIFKKENFDITTVRVVRPSFDNGLTTKQMNHASEVALDGYHFDYLIVNYGDATVYQEIDKFLDCLQS